MSAQVCDSQGIESRGDQDTSVWWWVMVREPRTLRSQLESLSWMERPPAPENQIFASCLLLQGALRVAFCHSDESWEGYAAGKISLQGLARDWGVFGPLWVKNPWERCYQAKGRQEKLGEAGGTCVCVSLFRHAPSLHPSSWHRLMTSQTREEKEHFNRLLEPDWQIEHSNSAFLHWPHLFLLWCNPLHFSFRPAGRCLCNIHEELSSPPWPLLRHHKSMHFTALQVGFPHKPMNCAGCTRM